MGSLDWMPPEQFYQAREATFESDVFGFGCVAWYLLTGVPPSYPNLGFTVTDYLNRQQALRSAQLAPHCVLPKTPPGLLDVLYRCLGRDPPKRRPRGKELAEAIKYIPPRPADDVAYPLTGRQRQAMRIRRQLDQVFKQIHEDGTTQDATYLRQSLVTAQTILRK